MATTRTQVGIVEWAHRVRGARAVSLDLAAKLGGWVPRAHPTSAKLVLARHAAHCGFHAELWASLLPTLHDVTPPGDLPSALAAPAALLARVDDPIVLYDEVFPGVSGAIRGWSEESTPIAERPLLRVFDLVLRDLVFDATEGHDLFTARPG